MKGRYVQKGKYIVLLKANGILQLLDFTYRSYFEKWLAARKDRDSTEIIIENTFQRRHLEFLDDVYHLALF